MKVLRRWVRARLQAEVSKRSVIVTLGYSEVGQVMSARPDIQVAINRMCDAQAENMDKLVAEHWLLQAVCRCVQSGRALPQAAQCTMRRFAWHMARLSENPIEVQAVFRLSQHCGTWVARALGLLCRKLCSTAKLVMAVHSSAELRN